MNTHLHCLLSLALKDRDGRLHHLPEGLDLSGLAEEFKRAVLPALVRHAAISAELAGRITTWGHHGGFSADASGLVPAGNTESLERVAAYFLRPPLSLARLTYEPGSPTAIYGSPVSPLTRGNCIPLDAKELLVRLLRLVPRPRDNLIRYYGAASSTWLTEEEMRRRFEIGGRLDRRPDPWWRTFPRDALP